MNIINKKKKPIIYNKYNKFYMRNKNKYNMGGGEFYYNE